MSRTTRDRTQVRNEAPGDPPAPRSRRRPRGRPPAHPSRARARGRLLDAAERAFAASGFDATPVRRLAREAGVAPGLVYYYFGTKEGVLEALVDERSVLPHAEALAAEGPGDAPLGSWLEGLARALLRLAHKDQPMARVLLREVLHRPGVRAHWEARFASVVHHLTTQFERRGATVDRAAVAARVLVGTLVFEGMLGHADAEQLVHGLVALVLDQVASEPAGPGPGPADGPGRAVGPRGDGA